MTGVSRVRILGGLRTRLSLEERDVVLLGESRAADKTEKSGEENKLIFRHVKCER